jgi:hypothetical protein
MIGCLQIYARNKVCLQPTCRQVTIISIVPVSVGTRVLHCRFRVLAFVFQEIAIYSRGSLCTAAVTFFAIYVAQFPENYGMGVTALASGRCQVWVHARWFARGRAARA